MKTLNIAAGKFLRQPWNHNNAIVDPSSELEVLLDTGYYQTDDTYPIVAENFIKDWKMFSNPNKLKETIKVREDAFKFMEKTSNIFDHICIYRFLEHVSFTDLLYFIYLTSTVIKPGGHIDIIVPDYELLARMILNENVLCKQFEKDNILLTTELLNEPSCPHVSIWTADRAKYFWELEGRFVVDPVNIIKRHKFDNRDIYLRFLATRV